MIGNSFRGHLAKVAAVVLTIAVVFAWLGGGREEVLAAASPDPVDQQVVSSGLGTGAMFDDAAQSFTAGRSGYLYDIELHLFRFTNAEAGQLKIEIFAGETLSGSALGSVTLDYLDIPLSPAPNMTLITFDGIPITEGQQYTIRTTSASQGGMWLGTGNSYSGGRFYSSSHWPPDWKNEYDAYFRTYVADAVRTPDTQLTVAAQANATYGDVVVFSAQLMNGARAFANQQVEFQLNGVPVGSAATNAQGRAELSYGMDKPPGNLLLEARYNGTSFYSMAADDTTITVAKRPITVTVGGATRPYGSGNPAFTSQVTGLASWDAESSLGTLSYTTIASAASNVGAYAVQASGYHSPNYTITYVAGTLTITKAPLTAEAHSTSRQYGLSNPVLTGTLTGLRNGDAITVSYSTAASTSSPAGVYAITPTPAGTGNSLLNYELQLKEGQLTVTKAPLTVTASNGERQYGAVNPPLSGSIVGLRNGDTFPVAYSTTATAGSGVGSYAITSNVTDRDDKLKNYEVQSVPGTLTVTKAPLSVTADNKTRKYGDANPVFTSTSVGLRNGDIFSVSYSTSATAGSAVGQYDITATVADQGGKLANYEVQTEKGKLTISKASYTVTVDDKTREYGDPNPVFTSTSVGLRNGDTFPVSYSTSATADSAVGEYDIIPSVADQGGKLANYEVQTEKGKLTISKASYTVTVDDKTREYGEPNPVFTSTSVGLRNGDTFPISYSTTATEVSGVGTYAITSNVMDLDNTLKNYEVQSVPGTLAVTKAPLTVTADNQTREYGEANSDFTGTSVGLRNGDTFPVSYSTSATSDSAVGKYDIIPSVADQGGKLANYEVQMEKGQLTITKAPFTVTVDDQTREYGDPNPVFTSTSVGLRNGDTFPVSYSTSATADSAVGEYDIIPTVGDQGGKLANYEVQTEKGQLTISKAPYTVTVDDKTREYGEPNPVFTSTNVGLRNRDTFPITYSTEAVPGSAVGQYDITPTVADQGGKLSNYEVQTEKGKLTVTQAPLTIRPTDASRLYGEVNPAFTGTLDGLKNSDDIPVAYTTAATAESPVGDYPITSAVTEPDGAASNYRITFQQGSLAVGKAELSFAATDAERVYGQPNPSLTGTSSGLKNGDAITADYNTAASEASSVGSYEITIGLNDPDGRLVNYYATLVPGTLTVTKASLLVTPHNAVRWTSHPNPDLTGAISGLANQDEITARYRSIAVEDSPAGEYPVTAELDDPDGKLSNYDVQLMEGTLKVYDPPRIGFSGSDGPHEVTGDISLPSHDAEGYEVVWTSSSPDTVVTATGKVNRPAFVPGDSGDIRVIVTAETRIDGSDYSVEYEIVVKEADLTNEQAVEWDLDALEIGYADGDSADQVTGPLQLPVAGEWGSGIIWTSSRPNIVNAESGEASRPAYTEGDASVELTATVTKGTVSETKKFTVRVLRLDPVAVSLHTDLSRYTMIYGQEKTIEVTATYSDDTVRSQLSGVTYTVLDASIVEVDSNGQAQAKAPGTTKVTIGYEGLTIEVELTVYLPYTGTPQNRPTATIIRPDGTETTVDIGIDRIEEGVVTIKESGMVILDQTTVDKLLAMNPEAALLLQGDSATIGVKLAGLQSETESEARTTWMFGAERLSEAPESVKASGLRSELLTDYVRFSAGLNDEVPFQMQTLLLGDGEMPDGAVLVRIDEQTGQFRFVPASFAMKDGRPVAEFKVTGPGIYAVLTHQVSFKDMDGHWADREAELLASKLIVQGRGDGGFDPEGRLTRAEAAALLVRALGLRPTASGQGDGTFYDTAGKWYEDEVAAAYGAGLIQGYAAGEFRPDEGISREQLAVMIMRAVRSAGTDFGNVRQGVRLTDAADVSDWAADAVREAAEAGIVQGNERGEFQPNRSVTRAQMVVMLYRMLSGMQYI
ncbi:MBG domain-containing protein [Paenibacillus agaridevorans]|uniref:MBG domain-containing protein n=1 Tax=Paenibacillus agaridevorans TaxID=171404 RepID=UPI001BE4AA75|nr:MBG domain-containing protein [Paenibacillus agaridevorans]